MQLHLDEICDSRFAGTGETGKPKHAWLLALHSGPRTLVHVRGLKMDVVSPAQCKTKHAGPDGLIRKAVNQEESTGVAVLVVWVKTDGLIKFNLTDTNLVQVQLLGRDMFQRL